MEAEQMVEDHLNLRRIPYKRNVIIRDKKLTVAEYDFIIPNAVIEVKSGSFDLNFKKGIDKLITQLERILRFIPKHFTLYYFFVNQLNDEVYDLLSTYNIKIMYDLNDLEYDMTGYTYYTRDTAVVRSLVNLDNSKFSSFNKDHNILTIPKYIYYRAVASMSDIELYKLNKINLYFTNDEPEKYIYLTGRKLSPNKESLWNIFYEYVPYTKPDYASRMLLFNLITDICQKCNEIKYDECIENNVCSKCTGFKNKKRKPDIMLPIESTKKKMRLLEKDCVIS
ncbi:hypothetical protein QKU48_gp1016 [Fadolivirus algeromassiliense]|jgi:hypothetical protein|uniref:Uncharacterized protein n=1 Tax=Fadolivirus FV1/VV64 TaxID=3070911 RepID=A0A7D3UW03_9VIRU|nr:hypothetical protein QKU48_gp1016 [Fadolivirus algeromassiliense]QKF94474.1 hypothetical protein Fadolivirus_1_1016 [Fadolivirus FV1/VV64]